MRGDIHHNKLKSHTEIHCAPLEAGLQSVCAYIFVPPEYFLCLQVISAFAVCRLPFPF